MSQRRREPPVDIVTNAAPTLSLRQKSPPTQQGQQRVRGTPASSSSASTAAPNGQLLSPKGLNGQAGQKLSPKEQLELTYEVKTANNQVAQQFGKHGGSERS